MNLALITARAARLFVEANGRVSYRACFERAALSVRLEARS